MQSLLPAPTRAVTVSARGVKEPGGASGQLRRCVRHATSDASSSESPSWPEAKWLPGLCRALGPGAAWALMTRLSASDRGNGGSTVSTVAGDAAGTHWLGRRGGG